MTNLDKMIQELEEANKKRTQEKWIVSEDSFYQIWTYPETNLIARLSPGEDFSFGKNTCHHNAEFIALAANNLPKLLEAVKKMQNGLDYYAKHKSVIKEAYHSNDQRQITCVHTFINDKAIQTLAEVEEVFK